MEANCTSHSVPPEIYSLMLSYLPVKSLLRFKSVCQEWNSIIDSRDFASLHLNQYATNNHLESRVIAVESRDNHSSLWSNLFHVSKFYSQSLEFDFSGSAEPLISWDCSPVIGGHIAGVFLLLRGTPGKLRHGDLVLWNPSIRKILNIPLPPSSKSQLRTDFWLGFDPSTNDYKVVSMVGGEEGKPGFEIFSLHSNSWRSKIDVFCQYDFNILSLSFGGYVFWLVLKSSSSNDASPSWHDQLSLIYIGTHIESLALLN